MRHFTGVYKTQPEIIVAFLWSEQRCVPTYELQNNRTKYRFIGSAGHLRARELARNAAVIPEYVSDKVERARGSAIGMNPRYEYVRFKNQPRAAVT
jgi:hypothetical protein